MGSSSSVQENNLFLAIKDSTHDIQHLGIQTVYFAKCPIRGWFLNHWALVLKRDDGKFLTVQFVKSGLEIERSSTLARAKEAVARCSITKEEHVTLKKLGKTKKTVGEIIEMAKGLEQDYNFVLYNCRHFVIDLLTKITFNTD